MVFFSEQNITTKVLSIMSSNDIHEIAQQMKIGDKILFKHCLEKWRADNNLPFLSQTNSTDFQSVSSFSPSQSSCSEFEIENTKIVLSEILKDHKHGCKILEYYEKYKKISEEQRSCLINVIVQHFESKDIHMSLETSYQLENQILK